ncbi:MAG: hypothetical protein EBE86_027230 [Hormoscilla sp. GUM202]|nr:hypothetical protein [Hormoscilla sp. GUM202]
MTTDGQARRPSYASFGQARRFIRTGETPVLRFIRTGETPVHAIDNNNWVPPAISVREPVQKKPLPVLPRFSYISTQELRVLTQPVNQAAIGATTRSKSGKPDRTHQLKITEE